MENLLISVIVPVYRVEKYLDRCVESIVNQTYTNIEIILVDDGSPDNCPKMCDIWAEKDSRIKVIHKENGGLSSARNAGLEIMNGKYVTFVDSDDYICDDAIYKLFSVSNENDSDLVIGSYYIYDGHNCYGSGSGKQRSFSVIEYWSAFYDPKDSFIDETCSVMACAKLYKAHVFNNIRFPDGKNHEDEFIIHQITHQCNNIEYIDEPVYYYFMNPYSIMHSGFSKKRLDDLFDALKNRIEFFGKINCEDLKNKAVLYYLFIIIDKYFTLKYKEKNKELAGYVKSRFISEYRYFSGNSTFSKKANAILSNKVLISSFFKHYFMRIVRFVK